jgi:hypothetical protein
MDLSEHDNLVLHLTMRNVTLDLVVKAGWSLKFRYTLPDFLATMDSEHIQAGGFEQLCRDRHHFVLIQIFWPGQRRGRLRIWRCFRFCLDL